MNVGDLRVLPREVVVNRGHLDLLACELREHRLDLSAGQDKVAHHRGVGSVAAKPRPGAEGKRRREGDITDPQSQVAAGPGVSVIAPGGQPRRLENASNGVPWRAEGSLCRRDGVGRPRMSTVRRMGRTFMDDGSLSK